MLSERCDLAAANALFQPASTLTEVVPDRVTTDGHDGYPTAIRSDLGEAVGLRTNVYLTHRLEQDHRGIKDRDRPTRGFKDITSAGRLRGAFDELRSFLRVRAYQRQHVSADRRRPRHLRRMVTILGILEAA